MGLDGSLQLRVTRSRVDFVVGLGHSLLRDAQVAELQQLASRHAITTLSPADTL